jgi:putative PIG3 family NAD(P)H quinone oxidoreductase
VSRILPHRAYPCIFMRTSKSLEPAESSQNRLNRVDLVSIERRVRDSNPWCFRTTVFKTVTFGRSVNPPCPLPGPNHCGARTLDLMRAMVIGPDATLQLDELPTPDPGPGQILIEVAAAGVNRADLLQLKGHHPPPPGAPEHPGLEASGTVIALGDGVTRWQIGDRVCALLDGGGYASHALALADCALRIPDGVSLVDAAGLPEAMATVWSNLVHVGGLSASDNTGRTVLVHGGSGGIGTTAIQLLRATGAVVFTTAGGPERVKRCQALGAYGIDHHVEDFVTRVRDATGERGVDVILDVVGAAYLERNVAALAPHGRLVVIGMQQGTTGQLDLGPVLARWLSIHGTGLRRRPHEEKAAIIADLCERAWRYLDRGEVRPVIDAALPLADAAEAHRRMADGEVFGKVLLVP